MINFFDYDSYFFDCDGVILDSNRIKTEAFYQVALPYGESIAEDFVTYHKKNGGVSRFKKCEYLISTLVGKSNYDAELESAVKQFSSIVEDKLMSCHEVDSVRKVLKKIHSSKTFVVSGAKQTELIRVFEHKDLLQYFETVCGSPKTKYEHMDLLIKQHKVGKGLFIGDSQLDYEVAKRYDLDFLFISGVTEFKNWENFFLNKEIFLANDFRFLI